MAILSALFSLLSKKISDLLEAVFGWSVTGLFGRLPSSKQTGVTVALILSLVWPLLIVGAFFMMVWMFTNAGIMGATGVVVPGGVHNTPEESMRLSGAPAKGLIACTYLFVASFAPTWGPVSWVYPPELYPLRVRGKAVALATSANWALNTALGAFVPPAFVSIKYKVYIVFGIFNLAMMIHAALLFPETAGKTLEDTEKMFEDPNGIPYIGTAPWKTKVEYQQIKEIEAGHIAKDKLASFSESAHNEDVHTGDEKV